MNLNKVLTKEGKYIMKDSRGFSLVELLVVIALVAILASGSMAGWDYITYADTSKCVKELNSVINRTKIQTMGMKDKPYLYIYNQAGTYYYLLTKNGTLTSPSGGTKLANKKVTISYQVDATVYNLSNGKSIKLEFSKNTGAFNFGANKIKSIMLKGASNYKITLYELTGKTKVEKL